LAEAGEAGAVDPLLTKLQEAGAGGCNTGAFGNSWKFKADGNGNKECKDLRTNSMVNGPIFDGVDPM
jgi:uncharacterized protein YidB (DUF937 family)